MKVLRSRVNGSESTARRIRSRSALASLLAALHYLLVLHDLASVALLPLLVVAVWGLVLWPELRKVRCMAVSTAPEPPRAGLEID